MGVGSSPGSRYSRIRVQKGQYRATKSSPTRVWFSEFFTEVQEEETADSSGPIVDNNGAEFLVGNIARVSMGNIKAHQVSKSGRGWFSENKEFVSDVSMRHLDLPVGLRGTITKVYNVDEISANFPVQVKFVPGEHTEEGYSAPCSFLMHFRPDEVECI